MFIDPSLFRDDAVSDETRRFNAELQRQYAQLAPIETQVPADVREARREGHPIFGAPEYCDRAREITIDGPGGDLVLRVIDSDEPAGVYVHVHGGGWVLGAADLSDVGNEAMCDAAGVTTVSIEYRLAPEHPYPAPIDDCIAGSMWVIEHAAKEFGTDRLVIGGESAGANLAAAVLLATRDAGYTGWLGANLVYGVYLPHGTPSVDQWTTTGLVLDPETMEWFGGHYVGEADVDARDPKLAPLYGDLTGMPPALFTVGTLDPLLDDTLFMAMRWVAAGAEADLAIYPGGIHAFDAFEIGIGLQARDRMHSFVRQALSA